MSQPALAPEPDDSVDLVPEMKERLEVLFVDDPHFNREVAESFRLAEDAPALSNEDIAVALGLS